MLEKCSCAQWFHNICHRHFSWLIFFCYSYLTFAFGCFRVQFLGTCTWGETSVKECLNFKICFHLQVHFCKSHDDQRFLCWWRGNKTPCHWQCSEQCVGGCLQLLPRAVVMNQWQFLQRVFPPFHQLVGLFVWRKIVLTSYLCSKQLVVLLDSSWVKKLNCFVADESVYRAPVYIHAQTCTYL